MKNIVIALFLVALSIFLTSCPKPAPLTFPPEVLPPATQTGANTYGCLVNGKVWIPGGSSGPTGVYGFIAQYFMGNFTLSAQRQTDSTDVGIYWEHINVHRTGTYYFNSTQATSAVYTDIDNKYDYTSSNKDSLNTYVTITRFDTVNSIISGTFNLLFAKTGVDTLRVTSGRFDVKYTN